MNRREFCAAILAGTFYGIFAGVGRAAEPGGGAVPFSREWLRARARSLALKPYVPPSEKLPGWVPVDWDLYQAIRFRPEKALWRGEGRAFQVRFFHLGLYFKRAVTIYEVADGVARRIAFSPEMFSFPPDLKPERSADLGFAGFRIHPKDDFEHDEISFLGASYFRATGKSKQYGLSARGLAIDTGLPRPEEFPDFREFWLERPDPGFSTITVHALMDSVSATGAYTFVIRPGERTM
ncbi:MAG TPA: glucan biosynthesis protein, partial [Thermodesulfobacteriota bacterium]|nr:glucan biosynthesis protein [Thermodesulfobacteriota bacterium]